MSGILDLSRKVCHVCEQTLQKNFVDEQEWCVNPECQVYDIKFNIPYQYTAPMPSKPDNRDNRVEYI